MCDLMVLAFQADLTRVATFVVRQRGEQPAPTRSSACPTAITTCRTTAATPEKQEKIREINRFHVDAVRLLPREAARRSREGERHAARQLA